MSKGWKRFWKVVAWVLGLILVAFVLLFSVAILAVAGFIEVPLILGLGWLSFIERTFPRIVWNWDLLGMAAPCLFGVAVVFQWFANWILRQKSSQDSPSIWPWRWTVCGIAISGLVLLSGMAVGGAAHQIGWMRSSEEPMLEKKRGAAVSSMVAKKVVSIELFHALAELPPKSPQEFRQLVEKSVELTHERLGIGKTMDAFVILLILDSDDRVEGAIVAPRDSNLRNEYGIERVLRSGHERITGEEWFSLLESYRGRLISF